MARPRTWNDDQLREAVASARTWNDVVKGVGRRPSARATRTIQGHVLRLGIKFEHLPDIPPDVPPLEDDWPARRDALPAAVRESQSWAEVLRRLGCEYSGSAYPAARRLAAELGLNTSHLPEVWNKRAVVPGAPLPFAATPSERQLRAAAIGDAISWFMHRGYVASIPVEPARYDLVVESDSGLKRVQVKSTTSRRKDQWHVRIYRMEYGLRDELDCNGKRGRTPYLPGEVDLFFVLTGDGSKFLIPIEATRGQLTLTLDRKYAAYKVD